MKHSFFRRVSAILLALVVLTAGAFLLLPPLVQEDYSPCGNFTLAQEAGPLNINTATAEELMKLPGIGETLSRAIVAYREENGAFSSVEDIMEVDGIGEGRFAAIEEYICVK